MSSFLNAIQYEENRNLKMLCRLVRENKPIGIYGAGGYAKTLINELHRLSIEPIYCVVDDKYYSPGKTCNRIQVVSVADCNYVFRNSILIIGFGMTYKTESETIKRIREQIDESIEIIDFEDQFLSYFYYLDYSMILKNSIYFQSFYDRLYDAESKALLVDYINGRISGNLHSMIKYVSKTTFDYRMDILFNKLSSSKTGKVIIECGAFDGKTAVQIYNYLGRKTKIYALECDEANYKVLKRNVHNYNGIIPINKGVWNSTGILNLNGKGQDAYISLTPETNTGDQVKNTIDVITLDDLVSEPVNAIIMDIEGAEEYALSGAKRIIETYRPTIAVRLYHKPKDFVKIPSLILNDLPYQFFLRYDCHYRGAADLTLYAI